MRVHLVQCHAKQPEKSANGEMQKSLSHKVSFLLLNPLVFVISNY